ncbi:MAG: ketoacyl-ACP synthase III [Planctomycetota bacterium]|nr:MAG: ketoacyl-ACP synthase III [Planctomycetota bacterium]REJ93662.1 MAG: ketoacyl-ACP synthase III [Planctomycetota bacterium]REK25711.1 MAG: ketoacyl-ACP synthase III [Planctomycetota bacterium]REK46543.1 MAG: ketoacyl-ACP synthase III [Planctomycetota bacterium]
MTSAAIGPIAIEFPDRLENNAMLQKEFPKWDMAAIEQRTGIAARYIAEPEECASDLAVRAGQRLFKEFDIDPASIDFLLLCTQTPDYPLPTTACIVQDRLNLRTTIGALDFNLGCSGFVYGLSLAQGLIHAGTVRRVLLITAETYSKYIDPADRSLRTIFGDAAAATLVDASDEPSLSSFKFGTDGQGADTLIVNQGGARSADAAIQPRHRQRWPSPMYMDGPSLITYASETLPPLIEAVLNDAQLTRADVNLFLFHQATRRLLHHLRDLIGLEDERMPIEISHCGNTVSSTIPILLQTLRDQGRIERGSQNMLIGFGVGLSWAGCMWTETWQPR